MDERLYEAFLRLERSHWWFVARQRILLELTRRFVPRGGRILDVGCGTGYYLEEVRAEFDAHGIDFSDTAVRMCHARGLVAVTTDTLEDLARKKTEPFNAIMFLDVIEHLDDDVGALKAAQPLLTSGGIVMVTVPAYNFLWSKHDDENRHRRRYVLSGVKRSLTAAGFRTDFVTYFNTFLFPLALVRRATQRLFASEDYDELALPAPWLNSSLRRIFASEAPIVRRAGSAGLLPFGLSIVAVGRLVA